MSAAPADVLIVGSGPAGLSVATALSGHGLNVLVLEAGDRHVEQRAGGVRLEGDELYPQSDVSQTRSAYVGGTSGQWSYRMADHDEDSETGERGCRYAPLDPIDLEARAEIPHSGWPLTRADLNPWYAKAQAVAGLGRFDYEPEAYLSSDVQPLPLDPALVTTRMFQFAPASAWNGVATEKLRAAGDVRIEEGVAVTRLETDATGARVVAVHGVRDGRPERFEARRVVLAGGGIDNSRLLLTSDDVVRGGLGNAHDQVGRYWMEHPLVRGGVLVAPEGSRLGARLKLYDAWYHDGTKVMAKMSLTDEVVRREGLAATSALLMPRDPVLASPGWQAYTALRSPSVQRAGRVAQARAALTTALHTPDLVRARKVFETQTGVDHNGWSRRPGGGDYRVFELLHQTEQTPDPENRVVLDTALDEHGRRGAVLKWRWSEADRRRITRARDLYGEAFARAGLARLIQTDWDGGQPRLTGGNHHHMGGTRISADPRSGVVDLDCRVHGVENVYVAGSSVFPAGGSVNPTLTIVALALRLGDHLVAQGLSPGSAPAAEPSAGTQPHA